MNIMRLSDKVAVFVLKTVIFLILGLLVHMPSSATGQETFQAATGVGFLEKYKERAEGLAIMMKDSFQAQEISKSQYNKGKILYNRAESAFNGWINELVFTLNEGNLGSSVRYKASLEDAEKESKEFIAYAEELELGEHKGWQDIVKNLVEPFKDVGLQIWKEYKDAKAEKRERLIGQLKDLKWKSTDDMFR